LLGAVLAVTTYGGVAAVTFVLTTPPFAELLLLPRWTVFAFFTVSGMALTSTIFQTPLFLILLLIVRRNRAAAPILVMIVGAAVGALAGFIFTYLDGNFRDARFGDLYSVVRTTFPVGIVLAVFVLFAAWLRRRGHARTSEFR